MERDELDAKIAALKEEAKEANDLDGYVLFSEIEQRFRLWRQMGMIVALMYKNTSDEDIWNGLFDVLSDAGLLDDAAPRVDVDAFLARLRPSA